jgi:hypothetical protein
VAFFLASDNCSTNLRWCARFSTTNCAKMYDMSLSDKQDGLLEDAGWQFGSKLWTEHVWDAFVLVSLLCDNEARSQLLEVPHGGMQKDWFTTAMESHDLRIIHEGQDDIDHTCDACTCKFEEVLPDGMKIICMSPLQI